jgi:outer membrane protein
MRNFIKIAVITLLIAAPTLGFAQKSLKFGHLSSEDILTTIPDRDSAMATLQKYGKELEGQLEQMQVELNNKVEKLRQDEAAGKLTSEVLKKSRYDEITGMQQRIQQFQEGAQTEYQQKQMQLMQPIIEKIKKAITDVGKENGFTYIFDTSTNAIPYVSADSQDVTALVKAKLGIKK